MDLYKEAGVDIEAGNETVRRIRPHVERTFRQGVMTGLGGFGGGFLFDKDAYQEPVLVSGTDGVGTKLKLAFALDKHDTIGIDAVAMCVNDILAMGAEPLFFLDYFATGKLSPHVAEQVVKGVAEGCVQAGAALIGGETAEMPDMYADGEYDIAGFAVGVVDRARMVDGSQVRPGDVLIGLASSGVHSNGYSLVRKVLRDHQVGYDDVPAGLGTDVGSALLTPTKIYVKTIRSLLASVPVRAMAHITGGGLLENVPRVIPEPFGCVIDTDSWPEPAVFTWLHGLCKAPASTLYKTWNMGIGFVIVVSNEDLDDALQVLSDAGEIPYVIGSVEAGFTGVRLTGAGAER